MDADIRVLYALNIDIIKQLDDIRNRISELTKRIDRMLIEDARKDAALNTMPDVPTLANNGELSDNEDETKQGDQV
jgi:hypothetical protein